MSQHDLEITTGDANTGASFRAAVNAALQALGTLQSGGSAPPTTYPYMLWADTTNGLLKIRNVADTAWLTVGTLAEAYLGLLTLANAQTITAQHTFNPGSATPPFVLGANAQGQKVTNLNADLLDGYHFGAAIRKNFIINGGCQVDQRVTDYALLKDTYGIRADRFYGMATGTLVSAGVLTRATVAPCGRTGCAFHFSGVTITGAGIIYLRYRIEAKDAVNFKNQVASFSAKIYHDVGSDQNYTIYIRKANAADNFTAVTEISNSGAQAKASGSDLDLKYENISMGDCSNGIEISLRVDCGAVSNKNFYFAELQFEVGALATEFDHQHILTEIILCQRYYCKSYGMGVAPQANTSIGNVNGIAVDANRVYGSIPWPITMRTIPTVNIYSQLGTAGKVSALGGADVGDGSAISETISDNKSSNIIYGSGSPLTKGDGYYYHFVAQAEL